MIHQHMWHIQWLCSVSRPQAPHPLAWLPADWLGFRRTREVRVESRRRESASRVGVELHVESPRRGRRRRASAPVRRRIPMERPALLVDRDGGTATVTISNPAKRNAMTLAMWRELPVV